MPGLYRRPPQPTQRRRLVAYKVLSDYRTEVLADSPSFVAPMSEASGSVTDIVGSLVGTTAGTPTYGVTGPVVGYTAIDLGGASDYFTFADHANLDLGSANFTIEAWLAQDTDLGAIYQCYVGKGLNAYSAGVDPDQDLFVSKAGVLRVLMLLKIPSHAARICSIDRDEAGSCDMPGGAACALTFDDAGFEAGAGFTGSGFGAACTGAVAAAGTGLRATGATGATTTGADVCWMDPTSANSNGSCGCQPPRRSSAA